jgi:hypothetical protein
VSPEDIARRYSSRHGYELIDYAPVALPLFRLTVDAVTMVHREIPPIKEFVMRCIAVGLTDRRELCGFLGLDEAIIDATLSQLRNDGYAAITEESSMAALLDRGRDVLAQARESAPQDEMLVFLYDRLLRKPIRVGAEQLIVPANINPQSTIEIRPYPADGPELGELSLADVLQVLEQQAGGRASFGRDLLQLKRIVRRMRVYRQAIGLVYKKSRGADVQVAFVIEDTRDESLEHAFAERGGPRKMGFLKSINESTAAAELRRHLGSDVVRLLPDAAALDEKRLKASLARIKYQGALGRVARRGGIDAPEAASEKEGLGNAAIALAQAEEDLRAFPARAIMPFEVPELLDTALNESKAFLAISSRDAGAHCVDHRFLKKLEDALQRGVHVRITLSEPGEGTGPALELERLRQKHPRLELLTSRRTAFYHLISDDRFGLLCNRPLLGNRAKVRTFQHVAGFLLQTPKLVNALAHRICGHTTTPDPPLDRAGHGGLQA